MFEFLFNEQGLSIERLHALVRLNECGSLIKAAGNDKGKQSRYSHYLRELSVFFGIELTARAGKVIRLTPAGKDLARIAQQHFESLLQFRQSVRSEPRDFRIGASDGLLQWLVIPTIGTLRRIDSPFRMILRSLRTAETIDMLQAQRLDFGLIRANAAFAGLKRAAVGIMRYAVVVPERLVSQRGLLTLKKALLDCPHAIVGSDAQMTQRMNELAKGLGGHFRPELICDSVAHCVTAIRSGYYAALIPLQSWSLDSPVPCHLVEGAPLERLNQPVVLAWHPRLMDVGGQPANRMKDMLLIALRQQCPAE
jgi:DNA-binding transcriptional LysR family regulator